MFTPGELKGRDIFVGLNERAQALVAQEVLYKSIRTNQFPDGSEEQERVEVTGSKVRRRLIATYKGRFVVNPLPLFVYYAILPTGETRLFHEAVEYKPWEASSSTFFHFFALQDENNIWVTESQWLKPEVEAMIEKYRNTNPPQGEQS